ncbi:MAG: glycine cleavage system protein H [Deltaproteobacteria bacterium]|nr:glycine cleavage system protein H [Deltaproteobacteria bacterium]
MFGNEFLSAYPAKLLEYSLGVGYLLLFIGFWRYLQGGRPAPAVERAAAHGREAPAGATAPAQGWFQLPEGVMLHPGHTWARALPSGLVEVGMDDFAARLLGPVERLGLPMAGAPLSQGAPAFLAKDGDKRVPLVSPVDGTVAEVNAAAEQGGTWQHEPYGAGWLVRVKPARLPANERQLLSGEGGRRWLEAAADSLAARVAPKLGAVLQDGGAPVHGIARELSPEHWDELCREYFRS